MTRPVAEQEPGVQAYERVPLKHQLTAVYVLDPATRAAHKTAPPPRPKGRRRR